MSVTVNCSLWAPQQESATAFLALVARMRRCGLVGAVSLRDRFEHDSRRLDLESDDVEFYQLIKSMPRSDKAVTVFFMPKLNGIKFSMDMTLYGEAFMAYSRLIDRRGPIMGWCSASQLQGDSSNSARYSAPLDTLVGDDAHSGREDPAVALFIALCGAGDCSSDPFEHAMLHLSGSWVTPYGATYLYHRDVREFSVDFARIYANFNWGLRITRTLQPGTDIWSLDREVRPDPIVGEPLDFERWSHDEDERLVTFLRGFQRRDAEKLAALSGKEMTELLHLVASADLSVTLLDFQDRGLCIAVPFPNLLASVFQRVAELAL